MRKKSSYQEIFDDEEHIHLPLQMRCTCHTLSLIATTDVGRMSNQRFSKITQIIIIIDIKKYKLEKSEILHK